MKRPSLAFLVRTVIFAGTLAASASAFGGSDCRAWNNWRESERDMYVMGFQDGVITEAVERVPTITSKTVEQSRFLPPDSTHTSPADIRKAVDTLCLDPANFALPLSAPIEVAIMRIKGATPQAVEMRLAEMRRAIANLK
jgi:hypothetical protein